MFKGRKKIDIKKGVIDNDNNQEGAEDLMNDIFGSSQGDKSEVYQSGDTHIEEEELDDKNQNSGINILDELNEYQYKESDKQEDRDVDTESESESHQKKGKGIIGKLFNKEKKVSEQAEKEEVVVSKPKSKIKSILTKVMIGIIILLLGVVGVSKLTGGNKGDIIEVSKDQIKKDISKIVESQKIPSLEVVEAVNLLDIKEVDIDEEDADKISDKISGKVKYVKYGINTNAKSLGTSADFGIGLLYVNINDNWQLFSYDIQDFNEWVLKPEETVTISEILKALQGIEFNGFNEGYIGNPDHTKVEIIDRNTDKEKGLDNLTVRVGIDDMLLSYAIEGDLFFKFGKEGWALDDENISTKPNWSKVKFSINSEPEILSREKVLSMVSEDSNLFTQIIDMKNVKKYSLYDAIIRPMEVGVGIDYGLNVEYEDLAIIKYIIRVPYEWTGSTWVERDPNITVDSALFINSLGTWFDKDTGDSMVLTDIIVPKDKKKDIEGLRGFVYKRGADGQFTQESFAIDIDIALRADNYSGEIEFSNGEKQQVLFDLISKEIKVGDNKFKKVHKALGFEDKIDIDSILDESIKRHMEEGDYPTIKDVNKKDEKDEKETEEEKKNKDSEEKDVDTEESDTKDTPDDVGEKDKDTQEKKEVDDKKEDK